MTFGNKQHLSSYNSSKHYQDSQDALKYGRLPSGKTLPGGLSADQIAKRAHYDRVDLEHERSNSLDKLEQLDKLGDIPHSDYSDSDKYCQCSACKDARNRQDEGATVYESEKLQKKAVSKFVSKKLARALHSLPNSKLRKAYGRSIHCSEEQYVQGGKIFSKTCGCRWCLICNRNRTADAINTYLPVVKSWGSAYMLTLTIPNVDGFNLEHALERMHSAWVSINRMLKKGRKRVTETDLYPIEPQNFQAIRKIECTYNTARGDFHPHYHFIIDNRKTAGIIVDEWLKHFPGAESVAQDVRPVDMDSLGALKELFKYFTKLFSKADNQGMTEYQAHVDKLDVIFCAMDGKRTLQPYGFKKSDYQEEIEEFIICDALDAELSESEIDEIIDFNPAEFENDYTPVDGLYRWTGENWHNVLDGSDIVKFTPSDKLRNLVKNIFINGVPAENWKIHPQDVGNVQNQRRKLALALGFPWGTYIQEPSFYKQIYPQIIHCQ